MNLCCDEALIRDRSHGIQSSGDSHISFTPIYIKVGAINNPSSLRALRQLKAIINGGPALFVVVLLLKKARWKNYVAFLKLFLSITTSEPKKPSV
jgi:hypothetical protein